MFVRIEFELGQFITKDEFSILLDTLSDNVLSEPAVREVVSGRLTVFSSYGHTFDPLEVKEEDRNSKRLVVNTEYVELRSGKEYLVDMELFFTKHPSIKVKVRGMVKTVISDHLNMLEQVKAVQDKLEKALSGFNGHVEFNEKCNVHVGNFALMNINQLGYAVDCCTEQLQNILNQGWRILAVCVQPDQRRPDYVLGRYLESNDDGIVECKQF